MLRAVTDLVEDLGYDVRLRCCSVEASEIWSSPSGPQIRAVTMINESLGSKRVTVTETAAA